MLTLYFFGGTLCSMLGAKRFMGLYLGGALVSSVCTLTYHRIVPRLNLPASWVTPYDQPT
jgi:membrane associated rhomboid family serine protease